jgi:hypothetical protein
MKISQSDSLEETKRSIEKAYSILTDMNQLKESEKKHFIN